MKKEYVKPDLQLLVFRTEVIATNDFVSGDIGVEEAPDGWN